MRWHTKVPQIQVPSLHPWPQLTPHLHSPSSVPFYVSERLKRQRIGHCLWSSSRPSKKYCSYGIDFCTFYLSLDFSLASWCISGANESTEEWGRKGISQISIYLTLKILCDQWLYLSNPISFLRLAWKLYSLSTFWLGGGGMWPGACKV